MAAGMNYLAVWRPGAGAQWWVTGWSYDDFKAKNQAYFDQGLRLTSLRVRDGRYTGVWHPGSGAQWWVTGWTYDEFKAKDQEYFNQGLRLEMAHAGMPASDAEWYRVQLHFLRGHHYWTAAARTLRDDQKERNIALLAQLLEASQL